MREILFKAKRLDNGEWVEGYYVKTRLGTDIKPSDVIFVPFKINRNEEWGWMKVDPNTLCQYTGLMDKNGQKVWENDICEMVYDGKIHIYVVWDKTELDFKGTNGKENYGRNFEYLGCCEEIVVIGNIFDNADLLEVE